MVKPVPGPDRLEKGIRFGCGTTVGVLVGIVYLGRMALRLRAPSIAFVGIPVIALLFGYWAMRKGDRFWTSWTGRGYQKPWNRPPGT